MAKCNGSTRFRHAITRRCNTRNTGHRLPTHEPSGALTERSGRDRLAAMQMIKEKTAERNNGTAPNERGQ